MLAVFQLNDNKKCQLCCIDMNNIYWDRVLEVFKIKAFSASLIGFESRTGHQQKAQELSCAFLLDISGERSNLARKTQRAFLGSCEKRLLYQKSCMKYLKIIKRYAKIKS